MTITIGNVVADNGSMRPLDPLMVVSLFGARSAERAGGILLEAAQELGGADEVFAYRRVGSLSPQTVLSRSQLPGAKRRCGLYTRQYHFDDPASGSQGTSGGFTSRVSAQEILRDDYRAICFEEPGFVEKLCFGWRTSKDTTVISFYRRGGGSQVEQGSLCALASVALSVMQQLVPFAPPPADLICTIETRFARLFPQLSARERQVCARTIAGWTSMQIARALGLKQGTVLTYRQRAYQRFGFQKASDFLQRLLH